MGQGVIDELTIREKGKPSFLKKGAKNFVLRRLQHSVYPAEQATPIDKTLGLASIRERLAFPATG
jgi:hypothetical protein